MRKNIGLFILSMAAFGLTSCGAGSSSTAANDDDDDILITQPVTNNPLIVPNHESAIPGLPSFPQGKFN